MSTNSKQRLKIRGTDSNSILDKFHSDKMVVIVF